MPEMSFAAVDCLKLCAGAAGETSAKPYFMVNNEAAKATE